MKTIILPEPIRSEGPPLHEVQVVIADVTDHELPMLKKWWLYAFCYFKSAGTSENALRTSATLDLLCHTNEPPELRQPLEKFDRQMEKVKK